MTVELTRDEAEILIAVLTFAEGAALVENPSMVEALKVLRPWRSALLMAYLSPRVTGNQSSSEELGSVPSAAKESNSQSDTEILRSQR